MKNFAFILCIAAVFVSARFSAQAQLARGVDISVQTLQEQGDDFSAGVVYYEYGEPKDALEILSNHDISWIRLRIFHTPEASNYGASMDLPYVVDLGSRVKAAGFNLLLDFHYSDTWADPGTQTMPAAWQGLSQSELEAEVYAYTRDVIETMRLGGAMPDMVQIGNETTCGMLWPNGEVCNNGNWSNLASLINQGVAGVDAGRGSEPMPEVMVHIDRGGDQATTQWFFDNLIAHGVQFDIIGQSFYPEWHGTLDDLSANLQFMADTYSKGIVLAEVGDYYGSVTGATPESQKEFLEEVLRRVEALPNGAGRGVFYWEPTWVWNSTDGYRALFQPTIDEFGGQDWDDVEMLMGLEAFNEFDKYSTHSLSVSGTVSGGIMDGHSSDNRYETITEATSGGKPANRTSFLEHKWVINNVFGEATLNVEAHKSANAEGDDFRFSYSMDDSTYVNLFTLTNTNDNNSLQSYPIPVTVDGTIYIRVVDTDRTGGNSAKDSLYIDEMFVTLGPSGEPCQASSVSAASLSLSTVSAGRGMKHGRVAVAVANDCGAVVVGATVTVTFSGDFNETLSAETDASGVATLTSSGSSKRPNFSVCIDDIIHNLPYDPSQNASDCGSY